MHASDESVNLGTEALEAADRDGIRENETRSLFGVVVGHEEDGTVHGVAPGPMEQSGPEVDL
ncbi:MAG: hypothetical protein COA94_08155 [Rickettsiales bacterium]|nr:MAG: hypothetical protein COA94_08155 [Rickettsiales bacterium]